MKKILIVFFILTFVLLVLIFPFKTRFMCHLNVLKIKGFYSAKIWRIRFLCGKIYANENGEIITENSADMLSKNYNKTYFKFLVKELAKSVDIKKIELFFTGGFAENSFSSAILCGSVSSSVQTLYSILTQKYDCVKLYEDIFPTFNHDNLEVTFDVVLSISFLKIILSIIKANFANNKLKEKNNER
jgi:hypothetical protein